MTYDLSSKTARFMEALKALPATHEVAAELLIISTGCEPGHWSYKHINTPGDTIYFIFKKTGFTAWKCIEPELNDLMQESRSEAA